MVYSLLPYRQTALNLVAGLVAGLVVFGIYTCRTYTYKPVPHDDDDYAVEESRIRSREILVRFFRSLPPGTSREDAISLFETGSIGGLGQLCAQTGRTRASYLLVYSPFLTESSL